MNDDFFHLFIRKNNIRELSKRIGKHKANNNLSFAEYKIQNSIAIAEELSKKTGIYLDTKFWIEFRIAVYNRKQSKPVFYEILETLKQLVNDGKVICPFSDSLFDELLKQSDVLSRRRTAQIADIVSKSYILNPIHQIMFCEFLNLTAVMNNVPRRMENYVWGRAVNLKGDLSFTVENEVDDKELGSLCQKLYYDSLMDLTLQELISFHDENPGTSNIADLHSSTLNNSFKNLPKNQTSIGKLHELEILSSYKALSEILGVTCVDIDKLASVEIETAITLAPTVYIFSLLYSYFQKDRTRAMKPNDYYDIQHSSLAVAHCNYFFTEKNFSNILRGHLKLNQKFSAQIEHKPEAILEIIRSF